MRIIAGRFKGRKLVFPRSREVRPAMDKVRESIFNVLREAAENADVLDVFAGSGSLGFEALSRGAQTAAFIENHPPAIAAIKQNAELFQVDKKISILQEPAASALAYLKHCGKSFNIIFAAPPYDRALVRKTLSQIIDFDILRAFGWVVIEHSKREIPEETNLYRIVKQSCFGATHITFLFKNG